MTWIITNCMRQRVWVCACVHAVASNCSRCKAIPRCEEMLHLNNYSASVHPLAPRGHKLALALRHTHTRWQYLDYAPDGRMNAFHSQSIKQAGASLFVCACVCNGAGSLALVCLGECASDRQMRSLPENNVVEFYFTFNLSFPRPILPPTRFEQSKSTSRTPL